MNKLNQIIETLQLEKHPEGGYFRRTFCSDLSCQSTEGRPRYTMSTIYYLVPKDPGVSALAVNQSDLILYHHQGGAMKVIFVEANGDVREAILGQNIANGQTPQVICPANVWKAYELLEGDYVLMSEAVSPSFDFDDMHMPTLDELKQRSPQHVDSLKSFVL